MSWAYDGFVDDTTTTPSSGSIISFESMQKNQDIQQMLQGCLSTLIGS